MIKDEIDLTIVYEEGTDKPLAYLFRDSLGRTAVLSKEEINLFYDAVKDDIWVAYLIHFSVQQQLLDLVH